MNCDSFPEYMYPNLRVKARNRASYYGRQMCVSALKALFLARDLTEVFSTQFHDRTIDLISSTLPLPYRVARFVNNYSDNDADVEELRKAFITGSSLNWDSQKGVFTAATIPATWNDPPIIDNCKVKRSISRTRKQRAKRQKVRRHFLRKSTPSGNPAKNIGTAGSYRKPRYSWFRRTSKTAK